MWWWSFFARRYRSDIFLQAKNDLIDRSRDSVLLRNDCCWEQRKWPMYRRESYWESYRRTNRRRSSRFKGERERKLDGFRGLTRRASDHLYRMIVIDRHCWGSFSVQRKSTRFADLRDRIRTHRRSRIKTRTSIDLFSNHLLFSRSHRSRREQRWPRLENDNDGDDWDESHACEQSRSEYRLQDSLP